MEIKQVSKINIDENQVILINKNSDISNFYKFSEVENNYINQLINDKKKTIYINHFTNHLFIVIIDEIDNIFKQKELLRKSSTKILGILNENKQNSITILNTTKEKDLNLSFIEGLLLSNYKFTKYFTKEKAQSDLVEIKIIDEKISKNDIDELSNLIAGVNLSRDLVNEPYSELNSVNFSEEIKKIARKGHFSCEILDKKQISSSKLGGILAVNKGSAYPPSFSILEWKPENSKNVQPIILVGKGIVYDTGGLSLKPTPDSMDSMKSDMAGAAAVLGLFYAIAKNKLPIHIIGLIPTTDNACNNNSYAPGDIIYMHDGTTVEVLNTDAEGRLVLADALSYAKKYKPELAFDLATLTGAAHRAIGEQGIIAMGNTKEEIFTKLKQSGNQTYERIVELPLWEEYKEMIKSNIADLKNIGGAEAGAITAGKFLEQFVDYPSIHLDIAPTAFLPKNKDYRGDGATGVGIRLLYDFLKTY